VAVPVVHPGDRGSGGSVADVVMEDQAGAERPADLDGEVERRRVVLG